MATWANITEFNEQYGTGNAIKNKIFIKVQKAEDCAFLVENLASIDVLSLIFLSHANYRQIIAKNQLYSLKMQDFTNLQTSVGDIEDRVDNIDSYIGNLNSYIDTINTYMGDVEQLQSSQKVIVSAINDLYDKVGDTSVADQIADAIEDIQEQIDNHTESISYLQDDINDLKAKTITVVAADGEELISVDYNVDSETGAVTYTLASTASVISEEIADKIDEALSIDSNQESIKVLKQLAYEIGYFKSDSASYWEDENGVSYSVIDMIMEKLNGTMSQQEIEEKLDSKLENININSIEGTITNHIAYVQLDTDDILLSYDIASQINTEGSSIDPNSMSISDALNILSDNIDTAITAAGVTGIIQGEGVSITGTTQEGTAYKGNVTINADGTTLHLGDNVSYLDTEDSTGMSISDAIALLASKINDNKETIDAHEDRLDDLDEEIADINQKLSYLEWSIVEE